jgi:hypothetical protein
MAVYTNDLKQTLTLEGAIKSGGEGAVHGVVGLPDQVAKVYHFQKLQDDRELAEKLRVMIANPPDDPMKVYHHISIAWPRSRLYANGRFTGYLMPRIQQPHEIVDFYSPAVRRNKHPNVTWKTLHAIARNLAAALAAVHARNYVVGDLNQGNIFVNEVGLVTLIDTDSFQVRDPATGRLFRCQVGKGEFTPVELQGRDLKAVDRFAYHDLFGLGVLLFQLLMEGYHPFTGVDPAQVAISGQTVYERNIGQGNFPYDPASAYQPPPAAPGFGNLHPQLQALFLRCFVAGHRTPSARPAAREWHQAIQMAEISLVQCRVNPKHWYARHLPECPWCKREKLIAALTGAGVAGGVAGRATPPQPPPPPARQPQPPPQHQPAPPPPAGRRVPAWLLLLLALIGSGGLWMAISAGGGNGAVVSTPPPATQVIVAATETEAAAEVVEPTDAPQPTPDDRDAAPTTKPTPRPTPKPAPTPRPPESPIGQVSLYNAASGGRVETLNDGDVISLSDIGTPFLNIEAEVDRPGVESIAFLLDGQCRPLNGRCLENTAPYTMAGDVNGDMYDNWDWSSLVGGAHTIEFVPYPQDDAQGSPLPSVVMTITVVP